MSIEAMRLALDALEVAESWGTWHRGSEAITALRAALAEATIKDNLTVEPVAWMYVNEDGECEEIGYGKTYLAGFEGCTPLYTAPPQRKPLTHPQIHELDWPDGVSFEDILLFVRAIERAHGIGGKE